MSRPISSHLAIITLAFAASACHVYSGDSIAGRVVDRDTMEPIAGAVVAVNWAVYGGLVHGSTVGSLHMAETVTDANGAFVLSAWGPKVRFRDGLRSTTPVLMVAHPGYYIQIQGRRYDGPIAPPLIAIETRACDCDEQQVEMQKLDGDRIRVRDNVETAERNLPLRLIDSAGSCTWQQMPRFAEEVLRRGLELTQQNVSHALPSRKELASQRDCAIQ